MKEKCVKNLETAEQGYGYVLIATERCTYSFIHMTWQQEEKTWNVNDVKVRGLGP